MARLHCGWYALADDLTLDNYSLISKSRVSRTDFEYTYHADITNTGFAVENVRATLSSSSPHTIVVDADLSFGSVGAGTTVSSADTFTIRQDRRYPFTWSNVSWDIAFDVPTPVGVLLQGNPGDLALNATVLLPPQPVNDSEIDGEVALTRLSVVIARDATVGEVNQALLGINARISRMSPGSPFMTLAIPMESSVDSITQVANQLRASPAIHFAFPARVPTPTLLPPGHTDPTLLETMQHLLPARFPAAWNAAGLIEFDEYGMCARPVLVLVLDVWHKDATMPQLYKDAAEDQLELLVPIVPDDTQPDVFLGPPFWAGLHGYDVMSTMAAKFDAEPPTGAMPQTDCFDFVGVPVNGYTWSDMLWTLRERFPKTGKFLINVSLGWNSDHASILPSQTNRLVSPLQRAELAFQWRFLTDGVKDNFLLFSAAGNDARPQPPVVLPGDIYPGTINAAYSNPRSVAADGGALFQFAADIALWGGNGPAPAYYPDLRPSAADMQALSDALLFWGLDSEPENVLVVGSTTNNELRDNLTESDFSDHGADVYAVGENIPPLDRGVTIGDTRSGTSFSTPQITGLAAYLWVIAPELRLYPSRVTRYLIDQSTVPSGQDNLDVVDAYLAALTFDLDPDMIGVPIIQFGEAPIRQAILDIDGDEYFEEDDLKKYLWAYYGRDFLNPETLPREPTTRNYSRFDLNGDGFTGGDSLERFDLDLLASPAVTPVYDTSITQSILLPPGAGTPIERVFDENVLTDFEILCYYAFSPLYQGDFIGTNTLEGLTWLSDCVDIEASLTIPAADIHFGSTVQLGATVQEPGGPILVDSSQNNGWEYFRWSSSDPDVAVVDPLGRMHVTGPGTATIHASYGRSTTMSTLIVPVEDSVSRSVPVTVQYNWEVSGGIGGCYSTAETPPVRVTHSILNNQVVFENAVVLPGIASVDDVGDPAFVWVRATGGTLPGLPVVGAQAGDLLLTNYVPGFALTEITSIGQDSDGCPSARYTVHEYKNYIADHPWRLWELVRQPVLPYTGGIDQALWVQITPPSPQVLDAGAVDLSTTSLGSALQIEIADGNGADAVTIDAVAPWTIQRLPAINPVDERENIVVILEFENIVYEVDINLTVNNTDGNRNLVVNDLAGWHCGLGAGPGCPGIYDADVFVSTP